MDGKIKVTLRDDVKEFDCGITAAEVAKSLGMGLYKASCACKVNGTVCDLRTTLTEDCTLEILTFTDDEGKKAFRHTAAHVMAQAVKHLYPNAKLCIGPAIDNGFYYDIDFGDTKISDADLPKIEKKMRGIIARKLPMVKRIVT